MFSFGNGLATAWSSTLLKALPTLKQQFPSGSYEDVSMHLDRDELSYIVAYKRIAPTVLEVEPPLNVPGLTVSSDQKHGQGKA
jgi:hypothetical protein